MSIAIALSRRLRQAACLAVAGFAFAAVTPSHADEAAAAPVVKVGDRVAIIGDSITEQKLYSKYIELYLQCCQPQLKTRVLQLGWSGETAGAFTNRMSAELLPFKANVVTTCYGMNDGGYTTFTAAIGKRYEDPMRVIVNTLEKTGSTVVVGGPGAVDTFTYKRPGTGADVYNANLNELSAIARQIAADHKFPYADVHGAMIAAMAKAKAANGEKYDVAGGDGVHPQANGHVVMAYAFLKAMGFDGNLGTIDFDFAAAKATATDGHTVDAVDGGKVTITSTRYPFCFAGDGKASNSTASILPFVPFNADLNRLTLAVHNLPQDFATVTWGDASKTFTKAELDAGVNLADAFVVNPFTVPFRKVEAVVGAKQAYETDMMKQYVLKVADMKRLLADDAEATAALVTIQDSLWKRQASQMEKVAEAVVPVTHTLTVTPVAEMPAPVEAPAVATPAPAPAKP